MKFLPNAILRKVAAQSLKLDEHAPTLLFGSGVVSMIGSTVLACRATLKLESVLANTQNDLNTANMMAEDERFEEYTPQDALRDVRIIRARGIRDISKLYGPAVILGGVGVVCLTKSHHILKERNVALTAAYAAVDTAYQNYRQRVIDKYGEDVDREMRYERADVEYFDEEGKSQGTESRIVGAPGSVYARWYDEESSAHWSSDPDKNLMSLRFAQNWANDRLRARGHVFLNEVYDAIGLAHTKEGAVVGWLWKQGTGDDHVDFGIYEGVHETFENGREGAILLDFNVDGPIYDKLPERHMWSRVQEEDARD